MIGVRRMFEVKEMFKSGLSISEISRRTSHDRKTIKKVSNPIDNSKVD